MKCSVFIATSLDGFIARTDDRIDWLSIVEREGEDYGYRPFFDSIDTMIVGRGTYDVVKAFDPWPYAGKRCIVLTHAQREAKYGEEFLASEPTALVERLAREGAQHAYVDGGVVIQQFLRAGLVSELTVSVIPILLGSGIRLFGETTGDVRLRLLESKPFESGLVQLRYAIGTA